MKKNIIIFIPAKVSICRVCLGTPQELINIFDKQLQDEKSIPNKILECTTVTVEEADNLPMNICKNCLDKLNTAYEFKMKFMQSHKTLCTIYKKKVETPSIMKVNCDKNDVTSKLSKDSVKIVDNTVNIISEVISTEVHIKDENDCTKEAETSSKIKDANDVSNKLLQIKTIDNKVNISEVMCGEVHIDGNKDCKKKPDTTKIKNKTEVSKRLPKVKTNKKSEVMFMDVHIENDCKKNAEISSKTKVDFGENEVSSKLLKDVKTIDKVEIQNEVMFTEVYIKEENTDYLDESNVSDVICEDINDAVNTESVKETKKALRDKYLSIKSMEIDYEKVKTMTYSEKKRATLFCKLCNKVYSFRHYFDVDLPRHIGQAPYKCKICNRSFTKRYILNTHMKSHGAKKFVCDMCGQSFGFPGALRTHKIIHTDEYPHKCQLCDRSFKQLNNLKIHINRHTDERPYVCEVCGRTFKSRSNFNSHSATHKNVINFTCAKCGKLYKTKRALQHHMLTHAEIKPYACNDCSRQFTTKLELQRHVIIHTGVKLYSCNVCDKMFRRSRNVTTHMRIHTGEKPFRCEVCLVAFNNPGTLNNHMKTHKKK